MGRNDAVKGSAKEVKVLDDLGSALVQEIVEQLNQAEFPISKTLTAGATGTARAVIGRWRYDVWVRDLSITNAQNNAFVGANTDIALKYADADDADMVAGPSSPTTNFLVEGFNTGNFPAKTSIWGADFEAGTYGDAVTGVGRNFKIPAGKIFYAEFINNEAAQRSIEVTGMVCFTDKLNVQPGNLTANVCQAGRDFSRRTRRSS